MGLDRYLGLLEQILQPEGLVNLLRFKLTQTQQNSQDGVQPFHSKLLAAYHSAKITDQTQFKDMFVIGL